MILHSNTTRVILQGQLTDNGGCGMWPSWFRIGHRCFPALTHPLLTENIVWGFVCCALYLESTRSSGQSSYWFVLPQNVFPVD